MDPSALRWVLAAIGLLVIVGVYLFTVHQNRMRRRHAFRTLTQDEMQDGVIEDDGLREELSNVSNMLKQQDSLDKEDISEIRINPALDASMKPRRPSIKPIQLPLPMQRVADQNLVAHILKHGNDRLLTGVELKEAFRHVGLALGEDGLLRPTDYDCFMVANLSESGEFFELDSEEFVTSGFVCFFDVASYQQARGCYEVMLKKVDELVRLLDLKVFNEQLQLLTLKHVTDTRDRLKALEHG